MSKHIEELYNAKQIAEVDLVVCGAGPAGVGAALRAARNGVKVMIVESLGCLGGVATAGMMSNWGGNSSSKILLEIYERSYEIDKGYTWNTDYEYDCTQIPHDLQMIVLEQMMAEDKVKILYYTFVCDAVVEEGVIKGVIVQNKDGRGYIKAKYVIDSTGDGDVAAAAGVPFVKGRETDGSMQPATLMFKIGGVDYERAVFPHFFETEVETDKGELQALSKQILPFPAGHVLLYEQPEPGTVCCNMTNCINVDGTKAEDLTRATLTCRSQILPIIKFLREYVPGYEKCWLMSSASLIGVRETRHCKGLKSLSVEDVLEANTHNDWVVKDAYFGIDVHNMTGPSLDATGIQKHFKQKNSYTIPYGCLVPVNVEGLLLSGRNISGAHLAHASYRIMSVCIATGEAAGAAVALAMKQGKLLKDINPKDIQELV